MSSAYPLADSDAKKDGFIRSNIAHSAEVDSYRINSVEAKQRNAKNGTQTHKLSFICRFRNLVCVKQETGPERYSWDRHVLRSLILHTANTTQYDATQVGILYLRFAKIFARSSNRFSRYHDPIETRTFSVTAMY